MQLGRRAPQASARPGCASCFDDPHRRDVAGYVRKTTQTLPTALKKHLSENGREREYQPQSGPTKTDLSRMHIWMHDTVHGRPNPHPETGAVNCALTVFHLWLKAPINGP